MLNSISLRVRGFAIASLAASALCLMLLVSGCATYERRPPPPTLDEIVQMSKQGVAPEEIIRRLKETGAVYELSGSKLAALREAGVSDKVLDYLQQTYVDAVRYEEWLRAQDWYWWGSPYWPGPYRRYPHYGYPWVPPPPPR